MQEVLRWEQGDAQFAALAKMRGVEYTDLMVATLVEDRYAVALWDYAGGYVYVTGDALHN